MRGASPRVAAWLVLGLTLGFARSAVAFDLYNSDGVDIRWDNTVRFSEMYRLEPYSQDVVANFNADDGDRNFAQGLVSNRFDLLSEFDISDGNYGVHASGAAWYDTVYHQRNNNNSPETFNPLSVPHNQFTQATEKLQGEDAELLDAFFYGSFDISGMPVSFRVGRHSLLWGESLFFADNGIAAGQAPIDAIKDLSEPGIEAKEVYRPVGQVSATIQPLENLAVSLYYQFEWERTRLPASGSYLSDIDYLDAGGERLLVQPGEFLYRAPDKTPSGSGQFGIAVHTTQDDIDLGFYALRYDAKEPEVFLIPGIKVLSNGFVIITDPSIVNLSVGRVGDYQLVYPKGIEIYGASVSFYAGDTALAGEISARRNMPLVSGLDGLPGVVSGGYGGNSSSPSQPGSYKLVPVIAQTDYPAGDTLHAQFSSVTTFGRASWWDGADLSAEIAANDVLDVTRDADDLAGARDRFATAFRAQFEPQYFQVLPDLDVGIPFGAGLGLIGRSSVEGSENAGAGDVELGVSLTWRVVWKANITATHYIGGANIQPLADRDFVSFSVERTF